MNAIELFEYSRWGENGANAKCPRCASKNVHHMVDSKTGGREKHYRWRCHDCKKQFTIRVGTIMHNSKISLDVWFKAIQLVSNDKDPIWGEVSYVWRELDSKVTFKSVYYMVEKIKEDMVEDDMLRDIGLLLNEMSRNGELRRFKKDGFYRGWSYQKIDGDRNDTTTT